MIAQLKTDVNSIRRRLSIKFLLMSYIGCTLFNIFFGTYKELGLIFAVILTLIWAINNTEKEYSKLKDRVALYRQTNDSFVIDGLISVKTSVLFVLSFIAFLCLQLFLCPSSTIGAYLGYFLYLTIAMYAINGEYNPLVLEKQQHVKSKFDNVPDEYIFAQNIDESRRDINDTWYSDPCLPGNPIFHINK